MIPDPRALIAAALDCALESIDDGSRLGHHPAWDSVGHLGVMLALEQHYGVAINDETIRRYESLEAIAALYRSMV